MKLYGNNINEWKQIFFLMMKNKIDIYKDLDNYFKELDDITYSKNALFSNLKDKEKYETSFMYSFRKYQAAKYHFKNVKKHLDKEKNKTELKQTI